MTQEEYKFYTPSIQDESQVRINNIMNNIHHQEEYIKTLLYKYKDIGSSIKEDEEEGPKGLKK